MLSLIRALPTRVSRGSVYVGRYALASERCVGATFRRSTISMCFSMSERPSPSPTKSLSSPSLPEPTEVCLPSMLSQPLSLQGCYC